MGATEPTESWSVKLQGPLTTPIVVNDTIYLTRGVPASGTRRPIATLEAYDRATGEHRWPHKLAAEGEPVGFGFHAPNSDYRPIYRDGRLYVTLDEHVTAFDVEKREQLWTAGAAGVFFNDPPTVTDEAVYVGGPRALVAFDSDGTHRWTYPETAVDDDRHNDPFGSPRIPAVANGRVYASRHDRLVALSSEDGSEEWAHTAEHPTSSTVVWTGDELVRAGFSGVEVVEADGQRRWRAAFPEQAVIRPAVVDETVFVSGLEGDVVAYDLASGDRRWKTSLAPAAWAQGTIPAVTDGAVHLLRVDEKRRTVTVSALDWATGETRWAIEKAGTRGRGPIPAADTYVFTTEQTPAAQRNRGTMSSGQDTTARLWAFAT